MRPDLLPYFSRNLRRLTKASQASGLRWAAQASKIFESDSLFDQFFDRQALVHVVNTTLPEDSVIVITGRLAESGVMRPNPARPAERSRTAAIMGTAISALSWRHWARTTVSPDGQPRIDEGFTLEPRPSSNRGTDASGIDAEQWRDLFVHRDAIENCIGRAIFEFIEGK